MKKTFIFLAISIVLLAIGLWFVSWLSWQPQSWYAPPDFSKPEVAKLADRAEYRLNEEFHKVRPVEDIWKLRITDEAINAWLAGRLEGWLTHDQDIELPSELHNPQVHTTQSGLWFAAMIELENASPRPLALQLRVWIDGGELFVEPIAIRLGKIPIPVLIFERVISELHEKISGVEAIAPLMDDRVVEIHAIEFEEGAIVLTCQTQLPQ